MGDERHDRGYSGEQDMGFFLGERGYFIVYGPGGKAGHKVTEKGFDGIAYNPKSDNLMIYDNKAYSRGGNVYSASSIDPDPDQNLVGNLSDLERQVALMSDMPRQARVLDLLRQTRTSVGVGATWPPQVQIAVSNAGGRKSGVSRRLASSGIRFIDYYQAPPRTMAARARTAIGNQAITGAVGQMLARALAKLGHWGIDREVQHRMDTTYLRYVQTSLARGLGVLVIVELQESDAEDFNGVRNLSLLDVYVQSGPTREAAIKNWEDEPHILKGAAGGFHVAKEYGWIPPIPAD